jgi:16S rRNA (guanine527-N7)-methyltransferase
LKERLLEGLNSLGLPLSNEQVEQLLAYIALLDKWNNTYNLTAVRDPQAMLVQHILDSLSMVSIMRSYHQEQSPFRLLDVGSGPGLPAIPLAIAAPEWQVTSLDGHHKRTAFVQQAIIELKLSNVEVVQARIEQWTAPQLFDIVISRAFSELNDFVELSHRHCTQQGHLIAMKGVYPYEEIERLSDTMLLDHVEAIHVPFLEAQRHAVILKKRNP